MSNIDIDDNIYVKWSKFYEQQNKIDYPSLKNFTNKKLLEILKKESKKQKVKV